MNIIMHDSGAGRTSQQEYSNEQHHRDSIWIRRILKGNFEINLHNCRENTVQVFKTKLGDANWFPTTREILIVRAVGSAHIGLSYFWVRLAP